MRLVLPLITALALSWPAMAQQGQLERGPSGGSMQDVAGVSPEDLPSGNTIRRTRFDESTMPNAASNSSTAATPDSTSATRRASNSMTRLDLNLLGRIAIAAALAFATGWEREFRGSEAGDRTFALVSLGAAAFTAVDVENFPASAEKVMAGVVTGVGFLGGGMILRDAGGIRGLTTAAAIWATAAIGMLAGVGELLVAALVTGLAILVLELQFLQGLAYWTRAAGGRRVPSGKRANINVTSE